MSGKQRAGEEIALDESWLIEMSQELDDTQREERVGEEIAVYASWLIEMSQVLDDTQREERVGEEIAIDEMTELDDTQRKDTNDTKISPTILRVPKRIYAAKREAYKPKIISLGPFHHQRLRERNDLIKKLYLDSFMKRYPGVDREAYITEIKGLEQEARSAYPETRKMDSEEFAEMMLLDCSFVLEFLLAEFPRKNDNRQWRPNLIGRTQKSQQQQQQQRKPGDKDPIPDLGKSDLPLIRHEILMLENQLPLFLLQKLFEKATGTGTTVGSIKFEDLISNFFHKFSLFHKTFTTYNINNLIKTEPQHHLLHLFLNCMRPLRHGACEALPDWLPAISCAKELSELKVKLVKKDELSILDIWFQKPRLCDVANLWSVQLEIPQLSIDDDTEPLFRNLIAFEQLFPEVKDHVSAYARFMGSIMEDRKDVELLRQRNILRSQKGDKNVVKLFKQLSKKMRIDLKSSYLGKVVNDVAKHCDEVREHRKKLSNKCWHSLKNAYLTNPWLGIGVAGAIILFVLTLLQTLHTLGYVKPKGN